MLHPQVAPLLHLISPDIPKTMFNKLIDLFTRKSRVDAICDNIKALAVNIHKSKSTNFCYHVWGEVAHKDYQINVAYALMNGYTAYNINVYKNGEKLHVFEKCGVYVFYVPGEWERILDDAVKNMAQLK